MTVINQKQRSLPKVFERFLTIAKRNDSNCFRQYVLLITTQSRRSRQEFALKTNFRWSKTTSLSQLDPGIPRDQAQFKSPRKEDR